jgi:hypothetical protein
MKRATVMAAKSTYSAATASTSEVIYISAIKAIFCTGSANVNIQEHHHFEPHELISLHVQHTLR